MSVFTSVCARVKGDVCVWRGCICSVHMQCFYSFMMGKLEAQFSELTHYLSLCLKSTSCRKQHGFVRDCQKFKSEIIILYCSITDEITTDYTHRYCALNTKCLILLLCFVSTGLVCMKSSTSVVELVMLLCSQVRFFLSPPFSLLFVFFSRSHHLVFPLRNMPFSTLLVLIKFLSSVCVEICKGLISN